MPASTGVKIEVDVALVQANATRAVPVSPALTGVTIEVDATPV